ncbi:MAG: hypothetical protein Q8Q15_01760 [bacterium]|nr:hypothetical protein [bacterium]
MIILIRAKRLKKAHIALAKPKVLNNNFSSGKKLAAKRLVMIIRKTLPGIVKIELDEASWSSPQGSE